MKDSISTKDNIICDFFSYDEWNSEFGNSFWTLEVRMESQRIPLSPRYLKAFLIFQTTVSHGFEIFNFLITEYDATPTYLSHDQYRMKCQLGKNAFDFLLGTTFLGLNVPNGKARDSSQSDEARVKLSRCLQLRPMKPTLLLQFHAFVEILSSHFSLLLQNIVQINFAQGCVL